MQYDSSPPRTVMLYYDYILTFPDELRYIWREGSLMRFSTLLYICCRYALLVNLIYLLVFAGALKETCDGWFRFVGIISIVGRAAIISKSLLLDLLIMIAEYKHLAVLGMRAYAICTRSKFVLCILLPLGTAILALATVSVAFNTARHRRSVDPENTESAS